MGEISFEASNQCHFWYYLIKFAITFYSYVEFLESTNPPSLCWIAIWKALNEKLVIEGRPWFNYRVYCILYFIWSGMTSIRKYLWWFLVQDYQGMILMFILVHWLRTWSCFGMMGLKSLMGLTMNLSKCMPCYFVLSVTFLHMEICQVIIWRS